MRQLFVLCIVSILLVGCGDDDSGPVDAGNPSDQCTNATDEALLGPYIADGGVGQTAELNDILRTCAQGSCSAEIVAGDLGTAGPCMSTCLDSTALADLSDGCADCWTGGIICTGQACVTVCLGTDEALCSDCVIENCKPQRDWCTGL